MYKGIGKGKKEKGKGDKSSHTFCVYVRKDNAHGPAVENPLNQSISALVRDSNERSDSGLERSRAQEASVID